MSVQRYAKMIYADMKMTSIVQRSREVKVEFVTHARLSHTEAFNTDP